MLLPTRYVLTIIETFQMRYCTKFWQGRTWQYFYIAKTHFKSTHFTIQSLVRIQLWPVVYQMLLQLVGHHEIPQLSLPCKMCSKLLKFSQPCNMSENTNKYKTIWYRGSSNSRNSNITNFTLEHLQIHTHFCYFCTKSVLKQYEYLKVVKTNYSNFRAISSKMFEFAALLSQLKIITSTSANEIA